MKSTTRVFTIHPRCDHIRCYPQFEELPVSSGFALNVAEPRQAFLDKSSSQLPLVHRKSHDSFFLFLFIAFIVFMVYTTSDVIFMKRVNLNVLLHGYDSWGNICGQNNDFIANVSRSGKDMTEQRFLLVAVESNVSLRTFCVSECPTHGYLFIFILIAIITLLLFGKCCNVFGFSVRQSVFNRCLPRQAIVKTLAVNSINITGSVLEEVMSDINVCWKEITYLCSISFVLALILLVLLRYIAGVVIWISLITLSSVACIATTYVWLLWHLHASKANDLPFDDPKRATDQKISEQWFVACLASTCTTIVFLLLVIVMRRRIQLVSILFKEAGKAISAMPFLLLQPILTTACIAAFCYVWLIAFLYLQACKTPIVDRNTGLVTYVLDPFYKCMKWCHLFGFLWISHFIVACQHFVIAGSASKWFFRRYSLTCYTFLSLICLYSRSELELQSPILASIGNLIRYHLGSIALGSLFVSAVKILRFFFKKIETLFSRYKEPCSACGECCHCCMWIIQRCVLFVNKNAYIEIAINGDSFCKSARRAFEILAKNALRVITVNSVGDFLLFLGKVCVVTATVFIGVELFREKATSLHYSWSPLILCAFFAYFVSHCFLAVYEMTIDTLLICFCEDQNRSGISRPHLVNSGLISFFKESAKDTRQ